MSWTFGSDFGTFVNSLEIISGSCDFFGVANYVPVNVFYQCELHVVATCLPRKDGDCPARRNPSGLGWWWRCDFRMKRNRSPDTQIRIFPFSHCGSSNHKHRIHSFNFWFEFWWLTCPLHDSKSCTYPRSFCHTRWWRHFNFAMHRRPWSSETNTFGTGPPLDLPGIFVIIVDPSMDLGLMNTSQYGAIILSWAPRSGLVLENWTTSSVL